MDFVPWKTFCRIINHHRIEQRDLFPEWRQHADGIERPTEKSQWSHDHQWDDLQFFKPSAHTPMMKPNRLSAIADSKNE